MVLYQVVSSYHLLCALVHRLSVNKDKECSILISNWLVDKHRNYKDLEKYFSAVLVYNAKITFKNGEYSETNDSYLESICNLNDYEEINILGGHYLASAYAARHDIKFIFWEDGSGMLNKKEVLCNIEKYDPVKVNYCLENGLYDGTNINVLYRVGNLKQYEAELDNVVDFDIVKELIKLDENGRKNVIGFFTDVSNIEIKNKSLLLLTQHFANLRLLTLDEQILIYQIFVDYFAQQYRLVIKPHPDDALYYSELFGDCEIIKSKFPSEFLPIIFKKKPAVVATISSTAINNIRNYFSKSICMSESFEKSFKYTHRYYVAAQLAKKLQITNFIFVGADSILFNYLFDAADNEAKGKAICYIIDDISLDDEWSFEKVATLLKNSKKNDVFIFINSKNDYCFYDINSSEIFKNLDPIVINKEKVKDDEFYSDENDETIYLYSKNKEYIAMARELKVKKELKNTGLVVSTCSLTEEQRQIKILEARLKATEERLKFYIDLYEESEKK